MRNIATAAFALIAIVIIVAGGILLANAIAPDSPVPCKFVLPDNFRGAFVVFANSTNQSNMIIKDNGAEIHVNSSGIVTVPSIRLFDEWIAYSAQTVDGSNIPYAVSKHDGIAIHMLFRDSRDRIWFYVGEWQDVQQARSGGPSHVESLLKQ